MAEIRQRRSGNIDVILCTNYITSSRFLAEFPATSERSRELRDANLSRMILARKPEGTFIAWISLLASARQLITLPEQEAVIFISPPPSLVLDRPLSRKRVSSESDRTTADRDRCLSISSPRGFREGARDDGRFSAYRKSGRSLSLSRGPGLSRFDASQPRASFVAAGGRSREWQV